MKNNKIINNTSIKLVITKNNICIVKLVIEYGGITNTTWKINSEYQFRDENCILLIFNAREYIKLHLILKSRSIHFKHILRHKK